MINYELYAPPTDLSSLPLKGFEGFLFIASDHRGLYEIYTQSSIFEAFSDIDVILESIICEKGPPLWEVTNHLQRIWKNRGVELDK